MFNEMCPHQLGPTSLVTRPYSVKLDILVEEKEGRGGGGDIRPDPATSPPEMLSPTNQSEAGLRLAGL